MKINAILLIILIVQISIETLAAPIEPYLSSPTSTSIWVSWRTTTETESKVEFGTSPDNLSNVATGTYTILAGNYQWHTVKLTGLTADTRYYYRVISDGQVSTINRFRSQPTEGTDTGHYRFTIIGDHQIINDKRYERLVRACKNKVIEKYATSASDTLIEDHLRLMVCDGDQVNTGTLDQYEKMHFGQSRPLMSNIPIMTVLGNHEYNSDPNLVNYFGHYVYDDISYKNIKGIHGEEYYAFPVANILFVMMNSSRGTDPDQYSWIEQIVSAADQDPSVEWVFAINHYCIYSEQMPGDGSGAVRDGYSPRLAQTDKLAMHITGHSHLYSRGSLRDNPCHVIINGGASGDQYWGQTTYMNYQDVQKTIERQIFQIVDIDLDKREMHVETYSNGTNLTPGFTEDALIDEFWLKLDAPRPDKPSIKNVIPETITLPFTFEGSEYSGQEPFNSIEYQVTGEDMNFDYQEYSFKTDYEDIFLSSGSPKYIPIDQNKGVDITKMILESTKISAGLKYLRFRYRDQSLHWSSWSDPVSFAVEGSLSTLSSPYKCPVLRYKLQGDAKEFLNRRLNGTPNSGVSFTTDTERGQVATFNNNGMITISSGSTANLGLPTESISVSCWVKLNSADYWGGFAGIFQDNGNYEKGWILGTFDNNFSFGLYTGTSMNYLTDNNTNIKMGEWYHIVGTFNGDNQKIYINGELKGIAVMQGEIEYPPTAWFQIGAYKDDNESNGHDGSISDVIIWERAITRDDVKNLYQNTIPPCADFEAERTEISEGREIQFDDISQFEPQTWHWNFEGGTPQTSSSQTPVVIYNQEGTYNVQLVVENPQGSDSLVREKYISVVSTVGTEQIDESQNQFKIFPNPAKNKINIKIDDPDFLGGQLSIQNANGSELYSQKFPMHSNIETIDLQSFPAGIYFIRLTNQDKKVVPSSFIIK